jgi:threonine dehydrogenase-like Zn-dependent dehydrogenase
MERAIFRRPGILDLERASVPTPGANEVLVRVAACGVCGSDRAIFTGNHPAATPNVLGHEFAGIVTESGALVAELKPGDRVTVDPNVVCGQCHYCRRGLVNHCQHLAPLGVASPGGFADYCPVPALNAYRIQDSTSFDQAAMVEPLACCVRGIERADVRLGDIVVVLGAGPIGLMLLQLARLRGAATVIAVDPIASRRELARALGADEVADSNPEVVLDTVRSLSNGLGADIVIESSGQTSSAQLTVDLIRTGGSAVWFGVCPPHDQVSLAPFHVNDRELTIRGSNINPFTHQIALTLIERKRVRVNELISDHIALDGLQQALAEPRRFAGKVIVEPNGSQPS